MGRNKKNKSQGIGDTIEKITEATGIKAVVDFVSEVTGTDCGCTERKNYLNKKFFYKNKLVNCPTDEMKEQYKEFVQNRTINLLQHTGVAKNDELNLIEKIYQHVKGFTNYKICRSCPNSGKEVIACIEFLDEVFEVNK